MSIRGTAAHVLRGAAIGVVEVIPGISGGTMALVVGIYERLIAQADHIVSAARAVLPGRAGGDTRPSTELRRLDWGLLVPVVVGMLVAVLVASRVLPDLIDAHPVGARAIFFGMVAASVVVPLGYTGMLRGAREWLLVVVGFAVAFLVSGLPPAAGEGRPPYWLVGIAAAVAICALVLPGFSGSFLLLVFGLYEPTLRAVAEFDLAYIAVFGLGAVLGLGSFVSLLQWMLTHHHRTVMVIATGVLLGALRALWPWQDDDRVVYAPDEGAAMMLIPALLGALAVLGIVWWERRSRVPGTLGGPREELTVGLPGAGSDADPERTVRLARVEPGPGRPGPGQRDVGRRDVGRPDVDRRGPGQR